jgi:hypothetical protein
MYKSSANLWELIIWGKIEVYITESRSFKVQSKYPWVKDDILRNKSSTFQSDLTSKDKVQIHLSENLFYKAPVKY